jgi:hypothetical protein
MGKLWRAVVTAVLLGVAGPLAAEPLVQDVPSHDNSKGEIEKRADSFVHRSSGFIYPLALADLPARKTITFGPRDAEVYYTRLGGGNGDPWLSLYVYPARHPLSQEREGVVLAIVQHWNVSPAEPPKGVGTAPPGAVEGWYRGSRDGLAVVTGYRVVQARNWFIKAQVTVPMSGGEAEMDLAARSLNAVPWAWQPVRETAQLTAPRGSPLSFQP